MSRIFLLAAMTFAAMPAFAQTTSQQLKIDDATAKARNAKTDEKSKEKVICRTSVDTGSLVKRTRRCMTSEQWALRNRGENDAARRLVQDNTGLVNGN